MARPSPDQVAAADLYLRQAAAILCDGRVTDPAVLHLAKFLRRAAGWRRRKAADWTGLVQVSIGGNGEIRFCSFVEDPPDPDDPA